MRWTLDWLVISQGKSFGIKESSKSAKSAMMLMILHFCENCDEKTGAEIRARNQKLPEKFANLPIAKNIKIFNYRKNFLY